LRYSREVRRRSGNGPAAVRSATPVEAPAPPVPDDPAAPILPVQPNARSIAQTAAPAAGRLVADRGLVLFDVSLTENLPTARLAFPIAWVSAPPETVDAARSAWGLDALFRISGSAGSPTF
jgi:hypothetical protein